MMGQTKSLSRRLDKLESSFKHELKAFKEQLLAQKDAHKLRLKALNLLLEEARPSAPESRSWTERCRKGNGCAPVQSLEHELEGVEEAVAG